MIEAFDKHNTPLNIAVELPSLEAIKKLVQSGDGVALVPRLTAKSEIEAGQLAAVSVKEMQLERKLHVVYRKNWELSHAAQEFIKIAKEING